MKQWIKSPRTEFVTMPAQFLDEPEAENGSLGSVVENVETD